MSFFNVSSLAGNVFATAVGQRIGMYSSKINIFCVFLWQRSEFIYTVAVDDTYTNNNAIACMVYVTDN